MSQTSMIHDWHRQGRITACQAAQLLQLRREIVWRRRPWWDKAITFAICLVLALAACGTAPAFGSEFAQLVGDGVHDDAQAIQHMLDVMGAPADSWTYGGTVTLPKGTYALGSTLLVPNGVRLSGVGPSATRLRALSSFRGTSLIRNLNQDGNQEFAFLSDLLVDGNQAGGAIESEAVVSWGSTFVNSDISNAVIVDGSNVGLHVFASNTGTGGSGPVLLQNVWQTGSIGHGILIEEIPGTANEMGSIVGINLCSEHVGSGSSAIYLEGVQNAAGFNFLNTHIEIGGVGENVTGITLDGVADVAFDGVFINGDPMQDIGIVITDRIQNSRFRFSGIHNHNVIKIIDDRRNKVRIDAVNVPMYASPDYVAHAWSKP